MDDGLANISQGSSKDDLNSMIWATFPLQWAHRGNS